MGTCNGINVHEEVNQELEPVQHAFFMQVVQTYANYQDEVSAVASLFERWVEGLHQHLDREASVRVVAPGEHALKVIQMMDRLRRLLDSLLERSKVLIMQLQRSSRDVRKPQPLLSYGDEMFAQTKGKRTHVTKLRRAKVYVHELQKDRAAWLELWNSESDTPGVSALNKDEEDLGSDGESPRLLEVPKLSIKRDGRSAFSSEHPDTTQLSNDSSRSKRGSSARRGRYEPPGVLENASLGSIETFQSVPSLQPVEPPTFSVLTGLPQQECRGRR